MQTELHLRGLAVIHRRAERVIRDKSVIARAEGIKKVPVGRLDLSEKHQQADNCTDCEGNDHIRRAEEKDHGKCNYCHYQNHDDS